MSERGALSGRPVLRSAGARRPGASDIRLASSDRKCRSRQQLVPELPLRAARASIETSQAVDAGAYPVHTGDAGLPPILVVDDNHDNAEIIRQYLEIRGYPITVAHNGDEALARVRDGDAGGRAARRDDAGPRRLGSVPDHEAASDAREERCASSWSRRSMRGTTSARRCRSARTTTWRSHLTCRRSPRPCSETSPRCSAAS